MLHVDGSGQISGVYLDSSIGHHQRHTQILGGAIVGIFIVNWIGILINGDVASHLRYIAVGAINTSSSAAAVLWVISKCRANMQSINGNKIIGGGGVFGSVFINDIRKWNKRLFVHWWYRTINHHRPRVTGDRHRVVVAGEWIALWYSSIGEEGNSGWYWWERII